jgi:hypothetical protein
MDPVKIMEGISKEIDSVQKNMKKAKTPEEKLIHSETLKNLCQSLGIFLDFIEAAVPYDEDDDIPF